MKNKTKKSRARIPQIVFAKAPGLLHMEYKVSELAEILGVADSTLRTWLSNGAPHRRDSRNHIWILGTEFAKWVKTHKKPNRTKRLPDNFAYCLRCKKDVELINPITIPMHGKLIRITGICPYCEITINRGGRNVEVN